MIGGAAKIERYIQRMREGRKIALKFVETVFRRFKKDELRAFGGESKSQCSSDGASGAGDKNRLLNER